MTTRHLNPPTARALEILSWIYAYCELHGYSPTVREACDAFGLRSPNAVQQHLDRLQARGLLELVPGTSRTARVTPAGLAAIGGAA